MASNLVTNAYMQSLLKTVYLSGVTNNKYQASPILSSIAKESWGSGKELKFATQYGNGGNFGADYNTLFNNATLGAQNTEWTMKQGHLTGLFTIAQPEILTSADERGAYMKILNNKMSACFDGMSKLLATYLYGGMYGVIDKIKTDIVLSAATEVTIPLTSAGSLKLPVGMRFVIAHGAADNTALPSSALLSNGVVFTVTSKTDSSITATASTAVTGTIYAGDFIEVYTGRVGATANATAIGPEGLMDIVPSLSDRTGATWDSYIETDFRGVDRSVSESELSGQFVKAASTGDTRITDALVSLLKKTKRAGGMDDIIILNDETWDDIGQELGVQKTLWQAYNSGDNKNKFTGGVSQLATAFGDAFISRTVIDPYCTEGLAYMLAKEDLKFYDLGNVAKIISPVANDQEGKYEIQAVGDQGIGDDPKVGINIDKLFTIETGTRDTFGPVLTIAPHVYGNFIIRKTASAGVANVA